MQKLYEKSELKFALVWIALYVVGTSIADNVSELLGVAKSLTLVYHVILSGAVFYFIKRKRLLVKYGLCRTDIAASRFLYYIPLLLIISCNTWFGVTLNMPIPETVLYIASMLCVGFLEEVIFRGFLFLAMAKDNLKSAIIVSSVTFGIGHIVNLVNGSGADLVSNLCQVGYAIAFGFLCVILFYRGKSLLPCIITHSLVNALSAFANEAGMTVQAHIISAFLLAGISIAYTLILLRTLPAVDERKAKEV